MSDRLGLGVEIGGTKPQAAVVRADGRLAKSFHVAGWDGFPLAAWLSGLVGGRPSPSGSRAC